MPVVKKMWEETQDGSLAWSIIRYFPVDYLKSNVDRLGKGRSYYLLCLRLADEKDFEIDESRLRETELLNVCCNSSRVLSKEKALDCLYAIVHNLCTWYYPYGLRMFGKERGYMLSILDNEVIIAACNSLKRLGMHDLVTEFAIWHIDVCEHLLNSDEFAQLYASRLKKGDYDQLRIEMTKKYYYEHLALKYKQADEESLLSSEEETIAHHTKFLTYKDQLLRFNVDETELKHYELIRGRALDEVYDLPEYIPRNGEWKKKVLARMSNKNPSLSGLINKFELTLPE